MHPQPTTRFTPVQSHARAAAPSPTRYRCRRLLLALLLGLGAASLGPAWAEGFRNPTIGTFGLGRSGAKIAQIEDASAVQYNPANLVDLAVPQLAYEQSLVYAHVDFTQPGVGSTSTINPWKAIPNAFAAWPLVEGKWAVGLGLTTPYGLSTEWDPNGLFRYAAPHFSELITVNFNPTVAVRLSDKLSLGAGVDVMWSQVTLKQYLSPLAPVAEARLKGDGTGVSANAGLTWQIAPRHRLAATVRLPMNIDYGGDATVNNVPAPLAPFFPSSGSFSTSIGFPMIIGAGYGFQVSDTVRLGTDFEWLQFSNFDKLPLGGLAPPVPENWRDTFTAGLGGDWQFAPGWFARLSYQFFQSPVPDSTFSPSIPDANQNVLTVGLAWQSGHHALAVSYGADFYDDRHITNNQNPAFNGNYRFVVHLLAASYRFSF
jgi:long-chain fatty acid transport protein